MLIVRQVSLPPDLPSICFAGLSFKLGSEDPSCWTSWAPWETKWWSSVLFVDISSTMTVPPSALLLRGKKQVLFVSLLSVCIGFKIHYVLCAFSCKGIKTTPLLSSSPQSAWYTMSVKSFFQRVLGLCASASSSTQTLNNAFSCWPSVNFSLTFSAGLCPSAFHSTPPFPELRQPFSYSA